MKPFIAAALFAVSFSLPCAAEPTAAPTDSIADRPHVNVAFDTRFSFEYDKPQEGKDKTGFYGEYLNLHVSGSINSHWSYNFRQRLNKFKDLESNCFGATDFIYVDYKPNDRWTFSAGKQVVAIGGFEYNENPINLFFNSLFWRNVGCYQFGVSGTYHFNRNHSLLGQVTNSIFTPWTEVLGNMYSYNLMWEGHMGIFSTLWSVNEFEYTPGRYGTYIALGNRIASPDGFCYFDFDIMNRYKGHQAFWFDDYSLIATAGCRLGRHFDIFVKGGYEHFRPVPEEPTTIKRPFYGAGIEYYPLKNSRDLRFHLVTSRTYDTDNLGLTQLSAGVTWYMDIFKK